MEMSHDHTDFGPQIPFLALGPIFAFLTLESIYFVHLYKISDRLMGRLTYLNFEPPVPSLEIRRTPIFYRLEWRTKKYHRELFKLLDYSSNQMRKISD
jgi:hypothetical protein